jgi:nitrogen regulatory protein P-II 1
MKKVELITRPEKLEDVKEVLNALEIKGITVHMVSGCGTQRGRREMYRGVAYDINLLPKVKVETIVKDESLQPLIDALIKVLRTGAIGDGKIFVYDVLDAIRIRTGEHGNEAI